MTLAYLTAYWGRARRMPDLKKLLGEDKPKGQTPEEMLAKVKMLNAAFGGTIEKEVEEDGT